MGTVRRLTLDTQISPPGGDLVTIASIEGNQPAMSAQVADEEEMEMETCPIEAQKKQQEKEEAAGQKPKRDIMPYYEIVRHLMGLVCHGWLTFRAYNDSQPLFIANIFIWIVHALLRSLIDYKYETQGINAMWFKFALLNWLQVRRVHDLVEVIIAKAPTMSIAMTRVNEAVGKQV